MGNFENSIAFIKVHAVQPTTPRSTVMLVDRGQSELKTQRPGESNVTTKGKILLQNTAKRLT